MNKKNRSDKYQSLFAELQYSNEMMSEFSESRGIGEHYLPEDKERLEELREQLRKERWRIINTVLTPRQRKVIELGALGYTQIEIAKQLGVNQSSITKSINGNCDYKSTVKEEEPDGEKEPKHKVYGGTKKKVSKAAESDDVIRYILAEICDIHSNYE